MVAFSELARSHSKLVNPPSPPDEVHSIPGPDPLHFLEISLKPKMQSVPSD